MRLYRVLERFIGEFGSPEKVRDRQEELFCAMKAEDLCVFVILSVEIAYVIVHLVQQAYFR